MDSQFREKSRPVTATVGIPTLRLLLPGQLKTPQNYFRPLPINRYRNPTTLIRNFYNRGLCSAQEFLVLKLSSSQSVGTSKPTRDVLLRGGSEVLVFFL